MSELNNTEISLLKDLRRDPVWVGLLNKLRRRDVPRYRKDSEFDPATQEGNWKYESGRFDENTRILTLLGDNNE